MCIASAVASRAQTPQSPREQRGAVGQEKSVVHTSAPSLHPSVHPNFHCHRPSAESNYLMERMQARSEVLMRFARPRFPLCEPPTLPARRALPRHLLELSGRHSSSVLHRDCETKRAFGARRLQHQAMPAGDHRAKQSACLGRLLGAGAW